MTSEPSMGMTGVTLLCATALACQDPLWPGVAGQRLLVGGGEQQNVAVVDPQESQVVGRLGPVPRIKDPWGVSPDGGTVLFVAFDSGSLRELVVLGLHPPQIVARDSMSAVQRRSSAGDLVVLGNEAVGVSPDGNRLLINGYRNDSSLARGIVVLDRQARQPVAFVGPLVVAPSGIAPLPPGPAAPSGAVLVIGTRDRKAMPPNHWLFVLDGTTLEFRDSARVVSPSGTRPQLLWQVLPSPDHQRAYVVSTDSVFQYDLVGREVMARARRRGSGRIAVSPDGATLYMTDPGDGFDMPGSGFVFTYDGNLERLDSIDLREDGVALATQWAAVSNDGREVYITAGTASGGPLFTPQPGRVLVVDAARRRLTGEIFLNDWHPKEVLVF